MPRLVEHRPSKPLPPLVCQDITIRKLQEEIEELEEQLEQRVAEEVEAKRADIETEFQKRVEEALEREVAVERKLQGAEEALQEAKNQAGRAQAKIFEVSRQAEEAAAAFQVRGDREQCAVAASRMDACLH